MFVFDQGTNSINVILDDVLLFDEVDSYAKGKTAECILHISEMEFESSVRLMKELSASTLIIKILEIIFLSS